MLHGPALECSVRAKPVSGRSAQCASNDRQTPIAATPRRCASAPEGTADSRTAQSRPSVPHRLPKGKRKIGNSGKLLQQGRLATGKSLAAERGSFAAERGCGSARSELLTRGANATPFPRTGEGLWLPLTEKVSSPGLTRSLHRQPSVSARATGGERMLRAGRRH